jgi:LemA protein
LVVAASAADRLAEAVHLAEVAAVRVGKTCPACGASNDQGARYCASCGEELARSRGGGMNTAVKVLLIVVVAFVGMGLLAGGCVISGYNKAHSLDANVEGTWAEVENQLQRRFDLFENLVATVKGVTKQEKEIFLGVAEARKSYFQADSVSEKAQAAGGIERALSRLLVLRERYPELKSNEAFLNLQAQVEGTENRLAVARKRYNDAVQTLNTYCRKIPGSFYCGLARVEKAEFFEVEEEAKERPDISFTDEGDAET